MFNQDKKSHKDQLDLKVKQLEESNRLRLTLQVLHKEVAKLELLKKDKPLVLLNKHQVLILKVAKVLKQAVKALILVVRELLLVKELIHKELPHKVLALKVLILVWEEVLVQKAKDQTHYLEVKEDPQDKEHHLVLVLQLLAVHQQVQVILPQEHLEAQEQVMELVQAKLQVKVQHHLEHLVETQVHQMDNLHLANQVVMKILVLLEQQQVKKEVHLALEVQQVAQTHHQVRDLLQDLIQDLEHLGQAQLEVEILHLQEHQPDHTDPLICQELQDKFHPEQQLEPQEIQAHQVAPATQPHHQAHLQEEVLIPQQEVEVPQVMEVHQVAVVMPQVQLDHQVHLVQVVEIVVYLDQVAQEAVVLELEVQEPVVQEQEVQVPVVQELVVQELVVQELVVQELEVQEPVVQEQEVQVPVVQELEVQELVEACDLIYMNILVI